MIASCIQMVLTVAEDISDIQQAFATTNERCNVALPLAVGFPAQNIQRHMCTASMQPSWTGKIMFCTSRLT